MNIPMPKPPRSKKETSVFQKVLLSSASHILSRGSSVLTSTNIHFLPVFEFYIHGIIYYILLCLPIFVVVQY